MSGRVEQIWLKRARRGPMDPVESATLVEEMGIRDSANFGSHRQVTIISLERWLEMTSELGVDVDPAARRAEVMISGLDLERSRGRVLHIGGCVLRIGGETRPCERMEEACRGLRDVMAVRWGGGAWAEVLRGGIIRTGDRVAWQADLFSEATAAP